MRYWPHLDFVNIYNFFRILQCEACIANIYVKHLLRLNQDPQWIHLSYNLSY